MIAASMNNNVFINKLLEVSISKIYNNLNYLIKQAGAQKDVLDCDYMKAADWTGDNLIDRKLRT